MNFYQLASAQNERLSATEKGILNYVISHEVSARRMSIRMLAGACYVSTATVLRLVRKMGFSGYREFQEELIRNGKDTAGGPDDSLTQEGSYREHYLQNMEEAVRMITEDKIQRFDHIMSRYPKTYILGTGFNVEVADYLYRLMKVIGYDVEIPRTAYELRSVERRIKREDILLVLSYSGDNQRLVEQIERIFTVATPTVISVTRADSNIIQNMSDLNFPAFADEIRFNGEDVTSRCAMIAIMEILFYKQMTHQMQRQEAKNAAAQHAHA